MSEVLTVPFPPSAEMVSAAEDAYMPFGDMGMALRMAILAAPAVQAEPVGSLPAMMKIEHHSPGIAIEKDFLGTVHIKIGDFDYIQIQYQYPHTDNARQLRHAMLIADVLTGAAPQPAEQQPDRDVRMLAASLYQACGAYDMPTRVLDVLSAAANGEPFAHMIDGLLPCVPPSNQDVQGDPVGAEQQPCPEAVREGAPYDDPVFEALCREHEIWGTAAAAQCAVFWEAGKRAEQQPGVAQLVEALEQIERWDGFPSTDEVWEDSGEPVSYGAAFGSNGERDFMREVARKALAAYRKQQEGQL